MWQMVGFGLTPHLEELVLGHVFSDPARNGVSLSCNHEVLKSASLRALTSGLHPRPFRKQQGGCPECSSFPSLLFFGSQESFNLSEILLKDLRSVFCNFHT